jgi:hypothetical protein
MSEQNKKRRPSDRGQWRSKSVRARYKLLPLDFILQGVNDWRLRTPLRFDMAKAALSYVHHKLTPIPIGGADREPQHAFDLTKLSDEELAQFERILAKSQVTVPEKLSSPFDDGTEDE